MLKNNGEITARDAFCNLDMTSASLGGRIFELKKLGHNISAQRRKNPVTGAKYTAYVLVEEVPFH